jgi:RNA polymerase sigma-70 factor (ECF subfamily)
VPRSRRLSDATLVRRSQQGDRRAFTALLTRYDWRLRGLAHALLLDPAEMDAALGVGYLRAWRDVVRISPSDNVAAWLYRVVYNACIDQLRRADGTASRAAAAAPPAGGVATGLAALPAAERVAVVLVDREGFSPSSAARILGLSPDAVTATLDRARATLGEHLPTAPPAAGVPDPPATDPVPAPVADPERVGRDAEAAESPAVGGVAPGADPPGAGGAAAVVASAAVGAELADTDAADTGEAEDTDAFEDHGPIDHEAVADAVVAEPPAHDGDAGDGGDGGDGGDPSRTRESDGAGGIAQESGDSHGDAPESDGVPGGAPRSDGVGGIAQESGDSHGGAPESDGASGNGNGNGAAGRNGHASNSGRGRRSRRRAKHAAAQQRPDGTGPAGDGSA